MFKVKLEKKVTLENKVYKVFKGLKVKEVYKVQQEKLVLLVYKVQLVQQDKKV